MGQTHPSPKRMSFPLWKVGGCAILAESSKAEKRGLDKLESEKGQYIL